MSDTTTLNGIYRVEEVAAILRCDKSTVYRLVKQGQIEVVRIGTSIRITQKAIDSFLGLV